MRDNNQTIDLYNLEYRDLIKLLDGWGFSPYFAKKIWDFLYVQKVRSLEEMAGLRSDLWALLVANTRLRHPAALSIQASEDKLTKKYLLELDDGMQIECVIMDFDGRKTACVSSQAGCAMGCVFCATGQMGFGRHLSAGEIVAQVAHIMREDSHEGDPVRNVVFMGMGEPLHNYEATLAALRIITDHRGMAIGSKYVTISTVGLSKAIRQLAGEDISCNLAVSLHAASDNKRQELVPVGARWPLADLMDACRRYSDTRRRRIFFEWAMIAGENDSDEDALALVKLLDGINSHVNLIPLNPTEFFKAEPSDESRCRAFQQILISHGVPCTVRQKRGIDVSAGCGQLRSAVAGTD